jgi:hypothetical protein
MNDRQVGALIAFVLAAGIVGYVGGGLLGLGLSAGGTAAVGLVVGRLLSMERRLEAMRRERDEEGRKEDAPRGPDSTRTRPD